MPPTMAEREAELAALQTAFDDYIASSRELEDELDAELAKMQEKLAESSDANMALVAQLENVNPQLLSLEKALAAAKAELEKESSLRRQAELRQDEDQSRSREKDGEIDALRDERDSLHEQLAFKDEELEELRLELDVERERHRSDMEEMEAEVTAMKKKWSNEDVEDRLGAAVAKAKEAKPDAQIDPKKKPKVDNNSIADDTITMGTFGSVDEATNADQGSYVIELEEALNEVTDELIEAEKKIADMEDKLADAQRGKDELEQSIKILESRIETSSSLSVTSEEEKKQNGDTEEMHKALQQQWDKEKSDIQEELNLLKEELTLTEEELRAAEEDSKIANNAFNNFKKQHQATTTKLEAELQKLKVESRSAQVEVEELQKVLVEATAETEVLREEVELLTQALENSKSDHAKALLEVEGLKLAFDDANIDANENKLQFEKELRNELVQAHQRQVQELQREINTLKSTGDKLRNVEAATVDTNYRLQIETKLKKTEEELERVKKDLINSRRELAEAKKLLLVSESGRGTHKSSLPRPTVNRSLFNDNTQKKRSMSKLDDDETSSSKFFQSHARSRTRFSYSRRSRGRSSSPTTIERIEHESKDKSMKIKELNMKCKSLDDQSRMDSVRVKNLEEELKKMQSSLLNVGGQAPTGMGPISSLQIRDGRDDVDADGDTRVEETLKTGDKEIIAREFRTLAQKSVLQKEHNAQLLVKILRLQGNIQVCCRIRPMKVSETQAGEKRVTEPLSETEVGCFDNRTQSWKSYGFDKVWGPDITQHSVFRDIEPLALSVVDGYNACIFAYGQTGSGKTFTMEGSSETGELGVSHRTIKKIFTLLEFRSQQQAASSAIMSQSNDDSIENPKFVYSLKVGIMEIYNDEVYDLLLSQSSVQSRPSSIGKKRTLDIRRSKEGTIEVPGLDKEVVRSLDDVMTLLKKANENRATASTNMNEHSSRSHMILNVEVVSGIEGEPSNNGNLFLVDLAGSERVRKSAVQGQQLKEASHINKSLAALGNVMEALDRKASHVPYRDSKLTYLLQDCLGGNSRTMMVVTVCPGSGSFDETQCALQFATRVRRINLGTAQRNVSSKNLEEAVKNLSSELKMLAKAKHRVDSQLSSLKRDHLRIQERLQSSTEARSKSNDEARTLTVLRKNNKEITARWQKEKEMRDQANEDLENCQKELKRVQTQLLKVQKERDDLTKLKTEKDQELTAITKELRAAKTASSAATHRARKAEALQSRKPSTHSISYNRTRRSTITKEPKNADSARQEVLTLLNKHDPSKVNKIDEIMDRFKGRESVLLQKMTDRYKQSDVSTKKLSSVSESNSDDSKTRSQLALARHKRRMEGRRNVSEF